MTFLPLLVLVGLAYLLLPVLSFVRTLQLGRELKDLHRRLALLERRLHDVGPSPQQATQAEHAASATQATSPAAAPAPPVIPPARPPRIPDWAREPEPASVLRTSDVVHGPARSNTPHIATVATAPDESLEERIGGRWLQHAGLIVLLLGIAFFLRYAFEHEWLSPAIRVALGIATGVGMAWGGITLASRYRAYGLLLAG